MKCAIKGCPAGRDPDGGAFCKPHQRWTAGMMQRCCEAIETALLDDNGLDSAQGEAILRAVGYWPALRGGR